MSDKLRDSIDENVAKLREFVELAGKATPIEKLALDLADEVAKLEAELYEVVTGCNDHLDVERKKNEALQARCERLKDALIEVHVSVIEGVAMMEHLERVSREALKEEGDE